MHFRMGFVFRSRRTLSWTLGHCAVVNKTKEPGGECYEVEMYFVRLRITKARLRGPELHQEPPQMPSHKAHGHAWPYGSHLGS